MRVPTKLKSISYVMITALIVLLSAIIWLLITTRSANSDLQLVDDIQTNFLERTSLRDQYFLYHEEHIRIRWEENKHHSDRLLRQAGLQLRDKETLLIIEELARNIDDTSDIFHRIVANSNALKSAGGNREILEELDKRLSSQLLLKATLIRDTVFSLKKSALKNVQQRNLQLTVTVILLSGSLSIGFVLWNILLKQEVKTKTMNLEGVVAELKKSEAELCQSQAILQAAMDCSPAGIAIADAPEGKLRYVNNAGLFIRGGNRQSVVNGVGIDQYVGSWQLLDLDGSELRTDEVPLVRAIIYGEPSSREFIIRRKEGDDRVVEGNAAPIKDETGNVTAGIVIFTDITDRKMADDKIAASLREKEILLKEIHHRVKNNLQIIASLLKLQSRYSFDEKLNTVFQECQERIRAMANVHSLLYRSKDLTRINFGDCIRETTAELLRSYQKGPVKISLDIHADEVMLSIDEAIPCSLIINELVTNALKYAFTETGHGEIRIELAETEQGIRLLVKDNGVGFPPELNFRETKTLGLQLVNMLVKQLDGTIEQSVESGTKYAILFVQKHISVEVPHEGQ
jgi:PAS domain S-box-containing protein